MAKTPKRARIVWFDDAAARFRVTPDTLREWIAAGKFPAPLGDGARLFYTEKDLQDLIPFLGRWAPACEPPGKSRKEPEVPGRGRKGQDSEGSTG